MAYSQQDLDAIEAAIATGALRVKSDSGREVWYRSLDEMRAIARRIRAELGISSTSSKIRFSNPTTGRGL